MTVVVDASAVVAALIDQGADGRWAEKLLTEQLVAPTLLPVEVANILRKAIRSGAISDDTGALAHADLLALTIEYFPYEVVAPRVWNLRATMTAYDAYYVGLAELLGVPLATLDRKLTRAPGPRCKFRTPPTLTRRKR
jgi:predicted nucleic acid-binding protein